MSLSPALYFFIICFFFFNDTATTEIYTLSLHDALPISSGKRRVLAEVPLHPPPQRLWHGTLLFARRSEEHTSELQSRQYLVCRLLLEKKKKHKTKIHSMLADSV